MVQNLGSEIFRGNTTAGLDMNNGAIEDMAKLGITECLKVKESALLAASEACEMILRVDEIIRCAP